MISYKDQFYWGSMVKSDDNDDDDDNDKATRMITYYVIKCNN